MNGGSASGSTSCIGSSWSRCRPTRRRADARRAAPGGGRGDGHRRRSGRRNGCGRLRWPSSPGPRRPTWPARLRRIDPLPARDHLRIDAPPRGSQAAGRWTSSPTTGGSSRGDGRRDRRRGPRRRAGGRRHLAGRCGPGVLRRARRCDVAVDALRTCAEALLGRLCMAALSTASRSTSTTGHRRGTPSARSPVPNGPVFSETSPRCSVSSARRCSPPRSDRTTGQVVDSFELTDANGRKLSTDVESRITELASQGFLEQRSRFGRRRLTSPGAEWDTESLTDIRSDHGGPGADTSGTDGVHGPDTSPKHDSPYGRPSNVIAHRADPT